MNRKLSRPLLWTVATVFACAPLVLAATHSDKSPAGTSSSQKQQSQQQMGSQPKQPGSSATQQQTGTPVMGSQMSTIIFAMVDEVNKEDGTVTLMGSEGKTTELDVPKEALSELQRGDLVEVTIDRLTAVSLQKVETQKQGQQGAQSSQKGMQRSSSKMSQSGSQSASTSATVETVDKQEKTVKLRTERGNTVELQIPQELLADLQEGESVNISIRKSQQQKQQKQQSGTSGSQSSQPKKSQ